jgi:hypothetical protein
VEPCGLRTTTEFDFFRGAPGRRDRPNIFDDGSLREQPVRKTKSFCHVGNVEDMSMERWGAAKWVLNQLRIFCANEYDLSSEPKDERPLVDDNAQVVSHQAFMDMLAPSFHKDATEADKMSVLKRTNYHFEFQDFLVLPSCHRTRHLCDAHSVRREKGFPLGR